MDSTPKTAYLEAHRSLQQIDFRSIRIDSRRRLGRARTRTNGARGFDMDEQTVGEEHAQQAGATHAEQPTQDEVGNHEESEDEEDYNHGT